MLEFIVLGKIPGTNIRISFSDLILFILLVIVISLAIYELHLRGVKKPNLQAIINKLAL